MTAATITSAAIVTMATVLALAPGVLGRCGITADCVTAGCVTSGSCNATELDIEVKCKKPKTFVCESRSPGYNVCQSPPLTAMLPCWMAPLDGSLRLNEISIPGTHDTMAMGSSACYQDDVADPIYTQTWSLRTMLDAGVRALDIRLRHLNNAFVLEHGIIQLPFEFDKDVRDVLDTFLKDNPSETVLMFYQVNDVEYFGGNNRTWEKSLEESMNVKKNLWITGSTIPTLDEARGKVVVANEMKRKEQNEYKLSWDKSKGQNENGTLTMTPDKQKLIRGFFDDGKPETNFFRLNYFSGHGYRGTPFIYPMTVAGGDPEVFGGTNHIIFEFSSGCLGVTMFDYIGEDAIAHIVRQQGAGAPTRKSS